jgi:hypothetical protein
MLTAANARECYASKNARTRTAANCGGELFVTRYASSEKGLSSKSSSAGNLAGKKLERLYKPLNLQDKSREFESSPGHHIFLDIQFYIDLSSDNFELTKSSACVRTIDD